MSIFPTKILLATDGSEDAELAALKAVDLANTTDSELHVVHVGLAPSFLMSDPATLSYDRKLYEQIEEESRELLRKLSWQVKVAGGTVAETHLRMGQVDLEIVALAKELGAGLIVMGCRGQQSRSPRAACTPARRRSINAPMGPAAALHALPGERSPGGQLAGSEAQ
jgi:nucleotide-binding universal stress UspA family protein